MVKTFRQDRFVAAAKRFALNILGDSLGNAADGELDLVIFHMSKGFKKDRKTFIPFCCHSLGKYCRQRN